MVQQISSMFAERNLNILRPQKQLVMIFLHFWVYLFMYIVHLMNNYPDICCCDLMAKDVLHFQQSENLNIRF